MSINKIKNLGILDSAVTTAKIADDAVTSAKIADSAVTNTMLAGSIATSKLANQNIGFRNFLINGDMSQAQRGTTFTSQTGVAYHLDRWEMYGYNMGDGVYRVDQSTDAPAGFSNSNKVSCTTADASQDANNQMFFQQMIEGLNSSHINYFVSSPDTVTLSFWVKSNRTGSYSLALKLSDNGSAQDNTSTRIYNSTYSVSVANTWENKTITIILDTNSSTKVVTNGFAIAVQFWLGGGTNRDGSAVNSWINNGNAATASDNLDILGSTSNDWYITGVQLEAGTTASDFENVPYDINLQRCERYYQLLQGFEGSMRGTTNFGCTTMFRTQMRSAPSVTQSGDLQITDGNNDFTQSSVSVSIPASRVTTLGVQLNFVNFSGLTQFRPAGQNTNVNDSKVGADAEL